MKIVDDVIKMTVIDLAGEAVHHQKPAVRALLERILRDQLLRQVIIKVFCFHAVFSPFLLSHDMYAVQSAP